MKFSLRMQWACGALALVALTSGCATPSLFSSTKPSSSLTSKVSKSKASKKGTVSPAADEIPDAHAVGLGVKGG